MTVLLMLVFPRALNIMDICRVFWDFKYSIAILVVDQFIVVINRREGSIEVVNQTSVNVNKKGLPLYLLQKYISLKHVKWAVCRIQCYVNFLLIHFRTGISSQTDLNLKKYWERGSLVAAYWKIAMMVDKYIVSDMRVQMYCFVGVEGRKENYR